MTETESIIDRSHVKGTMLVLIAIGDAGDGISITEIERKTQLSTGTVQRAVNQLEQLGWIQAVPDINENGNAIKAYQLDGDVREFDDAIKEVGRFVFHGCSGGEDG